MALFRSYLFRFIHFNIIFTYLVTLYCFVRVMLESSSNINKISPIHAFSHMLVVPLSLFPGRVHVFTPGAQALQ